MIESSLPLKSVESDFAVDSTGFATSRFRRWFDIKYGKFVKEHDWVKVHFICGVKTNVVTAVEIRDKDAADSPKFAPLFKKTTEQFTVKECSADKAYSSKENNRVGGRSGRCPIHHLQEERDRRCRRRLREDVSLLQLEPRRIPSAVITSGRTSNRPSNMIKAKFGDSVRSKTNVAMKNEALCKILCHNICCLIQSPTNWGSRRRSGTRKWKRLLGSRSRTIQSKSGRGYKGAIHGAGSSAGEPFPPGACLPPPGWFG